MGWDAGFVGELAVDATRFAALRKSICPATPIAGLEALSGARVTPRTFDAIVEALKAFEGSVLEIDVKPRKGTVAIVGALDEDAFRECLPALGQLFAGAAAHSGSGSLTLFGLESDEDLAHELAILDGAPIVRALSAKDKRALDRLRAKVGKKMAMRMPPVVGSVAEGAPIAVHPDWAKRAMFPDLSVSYRAAATTLELTIRTTRPHEKRLAVALRGFVDSVALGIFAGDRCTPDESKAVIERSSTRGTTSKVTLEMTGVDPTTTRVLVECVAMWLGPFGCESMSLASGGAGPVDVDSARMQEWLLDPWKLPSGPSAIDFPVEELPAKGAIARIDIDCDLAPDDDELMMAIYSVGNMLAATADPHGASRTGGLTRTLANAAPRSFKKAKRGGVQVSFADWSAHGATARGWFLAAFQRMHRRRPIRRVSFALP